jgi:hypothetical protein
MCFNDINNKLEETLQENIDSLLNLIQNIDGRIMKKGSESAIKEWTS